MRPSVSTRRVASVTRVARATDVPVVGVFERAATATRVDTAVAPPMIQTSSLAGRRKE